MFHIRRFDESQGVFPLKLLDSQPLKRFSKLLARAKRSALYEPTAVILATADAGGRPSARTVLLKGFDASGFVFYTNLQSRKARQLSANPRAALCFYWDPLHQQVSVEGRVRLVSKREADAYWATRPRESQIGAWASLQSRPLRSRAVLLARVAQFALKFRGRAIPRPGHWSGYRLVPDRIEFWTRKPFRLHERVLYQKKGARWTKTLLYP